MVQFETISLLHPRKKTILLAFALRDCITSTKRSQWVPLLDHRYQWLQVNLGNELTWVTGVATQGKQSKREAWVKKILLRYWGFKVKVQYYKGHGDIHAKVSEIENNP